MKGGWPHPATEQIPRIQLPLWGRIAEQLPLQRPVSRQICLEQEVACELGWLGAVEGTPQRPEQVSGADDALCPARRAARS